MNKSKYCCQRLRIAVEIDQQVGYSGPGDETEWYLVEGEHIYYCPFCGKNIKGTGFGKYDIPEIRKEQDKKLRHEQ